LFQIDSTYQPLLWRKRHLNRKNHVSLINLDYDPTERNYVLACQTAQTRHLQLGWVALLLIIIKAVVWFMSGSVSILASLIDSMMDAGASVLNLLAVRLALQPADHEHRFGHGKAEGIAALFQAAFIMGSALFLLLNAIDRIRHPSELHITPVVFAVMLASLVITIALVAFQQWILKQVHSSAVAADRLHYLTDILSNIAVLIALGVSLYGWHQADAIIGIGLALWIGWSAIGIGREALNMLMDKSLARCRHLAHQNSRQPNARRIGHARFAHPLVGRNPHHPMPHRIASQICRCTKRMTLRWQQNTTSLPCLTTAKSSST
jgi:cation diffusion facilitator family transporter